ncbi:hypothetical protein BBJ28_00016603, partial [Nothophytophthora sp. Chile5]
KDPPNMGNAQSGKAADAKGEWKGPFSDEVRLSLSRVSLLTARCGQLGSSFYDLCLGMEGGDAGVEKAKKLKLAHFVQGVAQCARASSQSVSRSLFRLFAPNATATSMTEQELSQLLVACLLMAEDGATAVEEETASMTHVARALARAALPPSAGTSSSSQTSSDDFVRWIGAQFPLLYTIFMSWMARKSFASLARPSYQNAAASSDASFLPVHHCRSHFVALSTVTSAVQTSLSRLYTSSQDGLSFNRLSFHLLGYSGPTLTVIRDTGGAIFGMFCDSEWKESSRFYGGNGCFLFRLAPETSIYRVTASGANENYMYLNSKGFALPRGLGMGGSTDKFRLFLSEDLDENSYSTPKCLSFESGRLSSSEQFVVDAMEVWGCGGAEGELSQKAHRQETADLINRARKVDKAQFAGSDFDKEFFLSKTFGHGGDRARVADDEH